MPSRRSKDFLNSEGEDQGDAIPEADSDEFFGDQRLPISLPSMSGNRHYKPASWLIPEQIRDNFPNEEGEDQGGKTPAADHCRESHFRVQNRSSDTCPPQTCHVLNQNVQGLTGGYKLKKMIEVMIQRVIHSHFLQETWLLRKFSKTF